MLCEVFYWKHPKYLLVGSCRPVPSPHEIEVEYGLFCKKEVSDDTTPEDLYIESNSSDEYVELPEGIEHTSLSVGDIVVLDNHWHVCMPGGWEEIK